MTGSARNDEIFDHLERLMMADPGEAVKLARAETGRIEAEGTVKEQLQILRLLVMALSHASQFYDALTVVEDALDLEIDSEARVERARIQLASMQPLAHLGRIDEAMSAGKEARKQLTHLGSDTLAGRASLNLGAIQAMTGHHHDSLESFDLALPLLEYDPILAGQVQTNRGSALTALDRFQEAEEAFSKAGQLLGDELPWAAAVVEGNLADLAARQGALHRSLKHFEASRRYLEQEDSLGDVGRLDAEEATVLSILGMTHLATELFLRAGNLLSEHGTPADLAMARLGFGRALVDAGQLHRAEEVLHSIEHAIDPEELPDLYRQYLNLATHIAIEKSDWDTASSFIATGLEHVDDRNTQKATWLTLQARVAQSRGDMDQARDVLSTALDLATSAGVSPLIASIYEQLSTIARLTENVDLADAYARKAINGFESIRGTIQADQMRKAWHQGKLGVYGDFALALIERDTPEAQREAFDVVERIRSRSLLDAIHQGGTDIEEDLAATPDEEPLLEELNQHRRWLNWTYSAIAMGQEQTGEQQSELREREQIAQRLEARLAVLRPHFGFRAPVDLASVQAQLDDESVLLSFLIIDEQLTLQVIDRSAAHGISNLIHVDRLSELVSSMQFQIGRALVSGTTGVSARREARLKRDMDNVLAQLYEALVRPVEGLIEGRSHCIVIPSGDLHSVPFAALRRGDAYLVDEISFTTAPSVSVLSGMVGGERESAFSPSAPLIIGVSDENAPGLSEEAKLLASRIKQSSLLLNERAHKSAVSIAMQQADMVHMACHGRFDPAFATASGLQLADGWLTLDDIRRIRLQQPLMVLSGCETGRARVDHGDDLVGLMTAMIASGAGELVTSLWKTHDHASMALMQAFYSALERGAAISEALRASQTEVQKHFAHPAMWAPFVGISKQSREVLV